MYSEENRSSGLAKFLSNYDYVYLDTCSLMEDGFPIFMDALVASKEYWKEGLRVIVPDECVKELKKHSRNKDKNDARIGAKRALKILSHDKWHGKTIEREKGITGGDFGDQAITQAVIKNRIRSKILVITQDKTLTRDLRNLNQLESQHGRNLDVYKITPRGELTKNHGEEGYSRPIESKKNEKRAFGFKKFFEKPQKKNEKEVLPSSLMSVQEADKKLASNLGNKNYPSDKSLSDINAQISALSRLSSVEKKKLTLLYSEDRLLKEKESIIKRNLAQSEFKKDAKQEVHEHFEKPLPKKAMPDPSTLNLSKAEKGSPSPVIAFKSLFEKLHVIVRDDSSVPYYETIHGALDVTKTSLDAAIKSVNHLSDGESKDINFAGKKVTITYKNGTYFAVLKAVNIPQKTIEKIDIDKKPSKNEVKAKASEKAKKDESAPNHKKEEGEKSLASATPAKKKTETVKKSGTEIAKERKANPEMKTAKGNDGAGEKANGSKKRAKALDLKKPAVSKESTLKKEEPKSALKVSDPLAEGSFVLPQGVNLFVGEPLKRGRAKKSMSKESKKEDKPLSLEEKMDVDRYLNKENGASRKGVKGKNGSELLKKALSSEAKLNANINNSNYPLKNKIRDLEEHKSLIKKLSEKDRKNLKLKLSDIDKRLKEFKKAA